MEAGNTKMQETARTHSWNFVSFGSFRGSCTLTAVDRLSAFRSMIRVAVQLLLVICLAAAAAAAQGLARGSRVDRLVLVPSDELPANVRSIHGNVIYVYDGDTFSVATDDHKVYTVRLEGA